MAPLILIAGGYSGVIHTLSFDPRLSPPTLNITSSVSAGLAPTWLVHSPSSSRVWSLDEWGTGQSVYTSHQISPTGVLTPTSNAPSSYDPTLAASEHWPCHGTLLTSTTPHRLLVATYKGATLSSLPLLPSGDFDLSEESGGRQTIHFADTGELGPVKERQEQDHPHGVHIDPTGQFVLVPDLGTDCLKVLRINRMGDLVRGEDVRLEAGDGPRHVLWSITGSGTTVIYILNELHNSISIYDVSYPSASSPSLFPTFTKSQCRISILPPAPHAHQSDFSTWHCAEIALSHDGRTLVASNRAEGHDPAGADPSSLVHAEDLLALFDVENTGKIIPESKRMVGSGGRAPRHLCSSRVEEREWVAVALHDSDEVVIFELLKGVLKEVVRKKGVGKPACVLFV